MSKIGAEHWARRAYVYVRQSTMAQTVEHSESTRRQYALIDRATSLGWPPERVEVVDEDLGKSGASTEGRTGFARLAEAVASGRAGAVLAIEVSRLARSSRDWQRLLALCSVTGVVVIDEHSTYDPKDANDKLLLDFKGTMSEAELRWLHLRTAGARQSKARRGELRFTPPVGFVWTDRGLEMDPDESVRRTIRLLFERFELEPSGGSAVRWARANKVQWPNRSMFSGTDELEWRPLKASQLYAMLRNPTYAGIYAYGKRRKRQVIVDGEVHVATSKEMDMEDWAVRIDGAHEGYISVSRYLKNREKLMQNRPRMRGAAGGAPREGPALLTGLALCGRCGRRMQAQYRGPAEGGGLFTYRCIGDGARGAGSCWGTLGTTIDDAVVQLFLETMVPEELELTLAVEHHVEQQTRELERQWSARLERARYEVRRAERRYKAVDPDNRVVARTLEREWEEALRALEQTEADHEGARTRERLVLSDEDRARVRALASDLPTVWNAPTTSVADRKAMLRLVFEAVALSPVEVPNRATVVQVQWRGGVVSRVEVQRPRRGDNLRTPLETVDRIRQLASSHMSDPEIVDALNREAVRTGSGGRWTPAAVRWLRRQHGIPRLVPDKPRCPPLPACFPDGRYSVAGAAQALDVTTATVRRWIEWGVLSAERRPFGRYEGVFWVEVDDLASVRRRAAEVIAARRAQSPAKGDRVP